MISITRSLSNPERPRREILERPHEETCGNNDHQ